MADPISTSALTTVSMATLSAVGVSFGVPDRTILQSVTLRARCGEFAAIIGPNGAGKSTLLRLLAGEIRPSRGAIDLDGIALKSWSPRTIARHIAFLPQKDQLMFPLSVYEIVMIGRYPHAHHRLEMSEDRRIVEESLALAGMTGFEDRLFTNLSGGEKLRVHIARVIAQLLPVGSDPKFLLLDEPTASLDQRYQHQILRIARKMLNAKTGVIAVLHDLNLAARYCDKIFLLHQGCLKDEGAPGEVLTEMMVQEVFGLKVYIDNHREHSCPVLVPW